MSSGLAAKPSAFADANTRRLRAQIVQSLATVRRFAVLDLDCHLDNDALSWATNPGDGALNCWGNTLPADELPAAGEVFQVESVPFVMPPTNDGASNNVICRGQLFEFAPVAVDWMHLLTTAERRTEDSVTLHYADGSADPEHIRVSDFWPADAHFGEHLAFRTTTMHYPHHVQRDLGGQIWACRIPVPRYQDLVAVRLPDNHAIHVFAATLELRP